MQEVHFKPANQARCSTFASDKTRAVRDGKAGREKQAARAAIKGKECSYKRKRVVGGGIWEADYKRTKTGDKDKGDSAPTVLSVRHFVHSNFGTRCFSIRGTILFKTFFSEWLDVRFLKNLRVMLIKKRQVQHSHRVFHEAAPALILGIGCQSVFTKNSIASG